MEINGKVYRNLEGQVGYLTEKWDDLQDQINDVKGKLTHYIVVEELPVDPEDIDTSAVYLVGPKGTEPDQYYEEWVYVETSEGTWSWEKLGDTDSVDLSGYLEKVTGTTTYSQLYAKHADGSQVMFDVSASAVANAVVKRTSGSQIDVPYTPVATTNATSKDYVDSHFVAKDTSTTTYNKAYIKRTDGTQDILSMSSTPNQGFIVQYATSGTLRCKDPTGAGEEVVNLSYAGDHYLAKNTSTSSYFQAYCKNTDGSQAMCNANVGVVGGALPLRRSNGNIVVPLTPTEVGDAASKQYVDDNATGVRYLHTVTVTYALNQDDSLTVLGHYVDRLSTPITSLPTGINLYMIYDCGKLVVGQNEYECAISKFPRGFAYGNIDSPRDGVLYTYESAGVIYTQKANSDLYTMTVTDTVTLF